MMGNAVRLASKDADQGKNTTQPVFCVPRGGNSLIAQATVKGKKMHISEKSESTKLTDWTTVLSSQFYNKPSKSIAEMDSKLVSDTKDGFGSNLLATAGPKILAKIDKSRPCVIPQGEKASTSGDSPRTEVRYIVLQPGQKVSDLLPLASGQDPGQPHLLYLGHLKSPHPPMGALPQSPTLQSPGLDTSLPHPAASSPTLCPPLKQSDSDNPLTGSSKRPKDVVPGTDDKYRTPGSSFLNKNGNIKRPMNAFMVWARSYRAKLASEYHGDTNSEISIKLGDVWNRLSSEEKLPFYEEAERIKNQHRKEFPGWVYKPTPNKRRQEETQAQQAHQLLWARFAGGSSSATLAAMATAAANQTPLQPLKMKQETSPQTIVSVKQEAAEGKDDVDKTSETPHSGEQKVPGLSIEKQTTSTGEVAGGQTKVQASSNAEAKLLKPTSSTQEVLKAKLCGQSRQRSQGVKGVAVTQANKSSPRSSKSLPKASKNSAKSRDQKLSAKNHKERGQNKKKNVGTSSKNTMGIERKEGNKYNLDLRSRSPVTPPSTPRTAVSSSRAEDPVEAVAMANEVTSKNKNESPSKGNQWGDVNTFVRTLTQPEFGPFAPLSPTDVPSDEILGNGRRARKSSEDLSRPERVTSDIYLDVDGWNSYLTSTESATKLTDDDVSDMFQPKHCKHGVSCTVCKSDLDLAPRPVVETLKARRDHLTAGELVLAETVTQPSGDELDHLNMVLKDPNICVEVEMIEQSVHADNVVDEIANSVYRTLLESCDESGTFNKPRRGSKGKTKESTNTHSKSGNGGSVGDRVNHIQVTKKCDEPPFLTSSSSTGQGRNSKGMAALIAGCTDKFEKLNEEAPVEARSEQHRESVGSEDTSVAMDTDSESEVHAESQGARFVDVSLSMDRSTHVVFKDPLGETGHKGCDTKANYCKTCIGCSLNVNNYQDLKEELAKCAAPSGPRSDCPESHGGDVGNRKGARVRPTSNQVFKTDDNSTSDDVSDSAIAPEVIPLARSSDPESQTRCEIYHRKMQTDVSKYKFFDTNRSAKSGRRLKSAQLAREGESMKLGVFGEEIVGQSLSSGTMSAHPVPVWRRVEIDDLDGLEGTGMTIEPRGEMSGDHKSLKLSPEKTGFPVEERRRSRSRKKMARRSATRTSEESESVLCQGDSASKTSDSNPDSARAQMALLKTILGRRERERERGWKDVGTVRTNVYDQLFTESKNRKSQMRSQITSKIYVARQTLPELPRKKSNGGRSSRSRITKSVM